MQMGGFGFDASKVIRRYINLTCDHSQVSSTKCWFKFCLCAHFQSFAISESVSLCCNFDQSLGAEKDGLDIIQHEWALPRFEQRAESVLRKLMK